MLGCHGAAQRHAATACPHARQLAQSYTHCCVRPTRIAAYGQRLTVGGQVGEEHAERAGGRLQRGPPHACTACAQHGRASHMACSSSPCAHMLKWAYRHGPAHLCQRSSPPVAPPPGRHEQSRGGKPPAQSGPGRMKWSINRQTARAACGWYSEQTGRDCRLPRLSCNHQHTGCPHLGQRIAAQQQEAAAQCARLVVEGVGQGAALGASLAQPLHISQHPHLQAAGQA